jgi:hypothetical protein
MAQLLRSGALQSRGRNERQRGIMAQTAQEFQSGLTRLVTRLKITASQPVQL